MNSSNDGVSRSGLPRYPAQLRVEGAAGLQRRTGAVTSARLGPHAVQTSPAAPDAALQRELELIADEFLRQMGGASEDAEQLELESIADQFVRSLDSESQVTQPPPRTTGL